MSAGRLRLSRFLVVPLALALVALAMGAPLVAAKNGGNSANAKMCQKDGWTELVRSDGTTFATKGECVAYAAGGGTLEPKTTAPVLDQSFYGNGSSCSIGSDDENVYTGQTFTAGLTGTLTSVALYPQTFSLNGLTVEIRSTVDGLPTSAVLASQTITSSVTDALVSTTFATPAAVEAGTRYAIVLQVPPDNVFACGTGYAGGDWVTSADDVDWFATSADLMFETWVSVP